MANRETVLVTGGSGALGRAVVRRLLERGADVRVLSRRPRPADDHGEYGWAVADLGSGEGLGRSVVGADVIVHCATAFSPSKEVEFARRLVNSAHVAGVRHLVYISIVGVDRIPFRYYRDKVDAEQVIADSGLGHTVLRATQFHDLLRELFAVTAKLPVIPLPGLRFQPIDVREVAARLAELADGEPAGRAPDIGGPRVVDMWGLVRAYLAETGQNRRVLPVQLPGTTFRAFREGNHLVPENPWGTIAFEDYLAEHPDPAGLGYRTSRRPH